MFSLFTALLLLYARTESAGQQLQKQADLPLRSLNDEFADPQDSNFLDSRSSYYIPYLNPGFFPALTPSISSDSKDLESDNSLDIKKRISRLVIDPHSKRWPEMFRVSPKVFREMRTNGQRFRPLFRKDFVDGGYKMSHTPARKRPYYYTEPEGSEFLGGPGK